VAFRSRLQIAARRAASAPKNQFGASAIVARRKLTEPVKSLSNVRYADGIEASRRATRAGASSLMAGTGVRIGARREFAQFHGAIYSRNCFAVRRLIP